MTPPGLSLVVVTCVRDEEAFERLWSTLGRFPPGDPFAALHVVVEGHDGALHGRLAALLGERLAGAGTPVRLWRQADLAAIPAGENGWFSQQILKLRASRVIESPFYLVLDSKNLLRRPLQEADFLQEGRPRAVLVQPPFPDAYLQRSWLYTWASLGLEQGGEPPALLRPTTPLVLPTATVRELLALLERSYGEAFEALFLGRFRGWSEFFLVSAYLQGVQGGVERLYHAKQEDCLTLWPAEEPIDRDRIEALLAQAEAADVPCLGIHRRALPCLTESARIRLQAYLEGLTGVPSS